MFLQSFIQACGKILSIIVGRKHTVTFKYSEFLIVMSGHTASAPAITDGTWLVKMSEMLGDKAFHSM